MSNPLHDPAPTVLGILFRRDPILAVSIVLSVSLSIALDATGAASGAESLLAGLAGTTLSLVLDSIVRSERRFHLRQIIEATPWFGDVIYPLAESSREIQRLYPNSLIVEEVRSHFEQFRENLVDLQRGRIERDGADYHYLIDPSRQVQHRIEAVTNIVPGSDRLDWWESEIGQHYWETNVEALGRGVRITRIFTYLDMTPRLERLIKRQQDAGVETLVLQRSEISDSLQINLTIWDSKHAWEARMNARGSIVTNIYTVNSRDIARLQNTFQRLRRSASHGDQ